MFPSHDPAVTGRAAFKELTGLKLYEIIKNNIELNPHYAEEYKRFSDYYGKYELQLKRKH